MVTQLFGALRYKLEARGFGFDSAMRREMELVIVYRALQYCMAFVPTSTMLRFSVRRSYYEYSSFYLYVLETSKIHSSQES
jgi:hypothetical protein